MKILKKFVNNYNKVMKFNKGHDVPGVPRDGLVSYHFNRRISAVFSALLMEKEVTPNQISTFVLILGIFTCIPLYLSGNYFAAGVMVWVVSILDGVDGEIARVKGIGTKLGKFIDSFFDRIFDTAVIFSIALSVSLLTESVIPWIFAYIAFIGLLLDYYVVELYGNRVSQNSITKARIEIVKKVRFWPARDIFLFIISVMSFINMPEIGLLLSGSLVGVFSIIRILIVLKKE